MAKVKKEYPIGIALLCSLALEHALAKYGSILQSLPKDSLEFISIWNRALLDVLKQPEFNKHLDIFGRFLLWSGKSKTAANFANSPITGIPYRSFYYITRFTDSFNFTSDEIKKYECNRTSIDIVDFGRGLSPWSHLLQKEHKSAFIMTVDTSNIINDIYGESSKKLGLPPQQIITEGQMKKYIAPDVFVSLGTFVYLEKPEQDDLLQYALLHSQACYVELELDRGFKVSDAKLVEKKGAKYHKFGTLGEAEAFIGPQNGIEIDVLSNLKITSGQFPKLQKNLGKATEAFVHTR